MKPTPRSYIILLWVLTGLIIVLSVLLFAFPAFRTYLQKQKINPNTLTSEKLSIEKLLEQDGSKTLYKIHGKFVSNLYYSASDNLEGQFKIQGDESRSIVTMVMVKKGGMMMFGTFDQDNKKLSWMLTPVEEIQQRINNKSTVEIRIISKKEDTRSQTQNAILENLIATGNTGTNIYLVPDMIGIINE